MYRLVYKTASRNEVQNYEPDSILSALSKVHEQFLYNEIAARFDNVWSKYQKMVSTKFDSAYLNDGKIEKKCAVL